VRTPFICPLYSNFPPPNPCGGPRSHPSQDYPTTTPRKHNSDNIRAHTSDYHRTLVGNHIRNQEIKHPDFCLAFPRLASRRCRFQTSPSDLEVSHWTSRFFFCTRTPYQDPKRHWPPGVAVSCRHPVSPIPHRPSPRLQSFNAVFFHYLTL
jgi:hypothetical protein